MHTMADLKAKTGYQSRAIRMFIEQGLVARPKHGGRKTMYDDDFLLRVLAIRTLRRERIPVGEIKARIRAASVAELRELARLPPIEAASNANQPASPAHESPRADATQATLSAQASLQTVGERWTRIAIAPGLDLLLRDGAAPEVTRLAMDLRARALATAP